MLKSYEYRLNPDADQEVLLKKHLGSCRWFYNYALTQKEKHYAQTKSSLSRFTIQAQLPGLKKDPSTKWLKEVNSQSLQAVLIHLETAYKNFFEKRADKPVYKSKKDSRKSFPVPQNVIVDFEKQAIDIPKFKTSLKFRAHRKFVGEIRQATVKLTPTGKWFISILVEDGKAQPQKVKEIETHVGVDVGIKTFATLSLGEKVENPRFLKRELKSLQKSQRSFSRKLRFHKKSGRTEWSKNLQEAKMKVAALHEKVTNQRKDFLHKLSKKLTDENQVVSFETLNIKGMSKNHKLARHILDCAWGTFMTFCETKANARGHYVSHIGRFEKSTCTCNACGTPKHGLKLSDREWVCTSCGALHDRDLNASKNIDDWGLSSLIAREDIALKPGIYAIPLREAVQEKELVLHKEAPTL